MSPKISTVISTLVACAAVGTAVYIGVQQSNIKMAAAADEYSTLSIVKRYDGTGYVERYKTTTDGKQIQNGYERYTEDTTDEFGKHKKGDYKLSNGKHTFITSSNGFKASESDDSPYDGVVASGDTVSYSVHIDFKAATKRTVNVAFDTSKAPWLTTDGFDAFCQPLQSGSNLVGTAKQTTIDGLKVCQFSIAEGAVATADRTVTFTAKDTNGVAKPGNVVIARIWKDDSTPDKAELVQTSPITVVSAPAADLVISDSNLDGASTTSYFDLMDSETSDPGDLSGRFLIKPLPLKYKSIYSSYGASTTGPWSSTVDVSAFPDNTKWTFDGKPVEVKDGKIQIGGADTSGNKSLSYAIPKISFLKNTLEAAVNEANTYKSENYSATSWKNFETARTAAAKALAAINVNDDSSKSNYAAQKAWVALMTASTSLETTNGSQTALRSFYRGSTNSYDIQIIPPDTVFQTEADGLKNNGVGGEPGMGKDRDYSTYDVQTGATAGSPYANNDWSRATVYFPPTPVPPGMFNKYIYKPSAAGKTIFDDESHSFDTAGGESMVYHNNRTGDNIDVDTELRTSLIANTANNWGTGSMKNTCTTNDQSCAVEFLDVIDPVEQTYRGDFKVSFAGKVIDPSLYDVRWTKDVKLEWQNGSEKSIPVINNTSSASTSDTDFKSRFTVGTGDKQVSVFDANSGITWHDGIPTADDAPSAIYVIVKKTKPAEGSNPAVSTGVTFGDENGNGGGMLEVSFVMKAGRQSNDSSATDCGVLDNEKIKCNWNANDQAYENYHSKNGTASLNPTEYARVVRPGPPTTYIDYTVSAQGQSSLGTVDRQNSNVYPGDITTWTAHPSIASIAFSDATASPWACVSIPSGVLNFKNTSSSWTVKNDASACKTSENDTTDWRLFEFTGDKSRLAVNSDETMPLPSITWTGTVSNKAGSEQTSNVILHTDVAQKGTWGPYSTEKKNGYTQISKAQDTAQINVNNDSSNSGVLHADQDKVEIYNPMSFTFNVYAKGYKTKICTAADIKDTNDVCSTMQEVGGVQQHVYKAGDIVVLNGNNHTGVMQTIVAMPNTNGDEGKLLGSKNGDYYTGADGNWGGYSRGQSKYVGDYKTTSLKIDAGNSTNVKIEYTTDSITKTSGTSNNPIDNTHDYNWKTIYCDGKNADDSGSCSEIDGKISFTIPDADKAKVTAFRVSSSFENGFVNGQKDLPVAAANGTITIDPDNNRQYNQYNMWIGNNSFDDGSANGNLPWPDKTVTVASSISGTLWWDENNDATRGTGANAEPHVCLNDEKTKNSECSASTTGHGVKVSLWRYKTVNGKNVYYGADESKTYDSVDDAINANAAPYRSMTTWNDGRSIQKLSDGFEYTNENDWTDPDGVKQAKDSKLMGWSGGYQFNNLHSGGYVTSVSRNSTDDTSGDSVPSKTKKSEDYYGISRNIKNTYSWDQSFDKAKNSSQDIALGKEYWQKNVDYGFVKPVYQIQLNKQVTSTQCDNDTLKCIVQWAVSIKNSGNMPINGGTLTDSMDKNVSNVTSSINPMSPGYAKVYSTGSHSLVLSTANGKLYGWGFNQWGQVGIANIDHMNDSVPSPVAIAVPGKVTAAAAGTMHSAAVANGRLYTWGLGDSGQLGRGSTTSVDVVNSSPTAVDVTGATGPIVDVAAGADFTVAIDSDGNVFKTTSSGGWNKISDENADISGHGKLSAFGDNAAFVGKDKKVYTISSNTATVITNIDNAVQIAQGYDYTLILQAVKDSNEKTVATRVYETSSSSFSSNLPTGYLQFDTDQPIVSVSAGYGNNYAVDAAGKIYSWGVNNYGQLGRRPGSKNTPNDGRIYDNGDIKPGVIDPTPTRLNNASDQIYDYADEYMRGYDINDFGSETEIDTSNMIAASFQHAVFTTNTDDSTKIKTLGLDAYGKHVADDVIDLKSIKGTTAGVLCFDNKHGKNCDASADTTKLDNATMSNVDNVDVGDAIDTTKTTPIETPAGKDNNDGFIDRIYDIKSNGIEKIGPGESLNYVFTGEIKMNPATVKKYGKAVYDSEGKYSFIKDDGTTSSDINQIGTCNGKDDSGVAGSSNWVCLPVLYEDGAAKYVPNQAWFDWSGGDSSDKTPYVSTPVQKKNNTANPTKPLNADGLAKSAKNGSLDEHWDSGTQDLIGVESCKSGSDLGGEANEHTFEISVGNEDQCDQVAIKIVGQHLDVTSGGKIYGTISGRYWIDDDSDGKRDDSSGGAYKGSEQPISGQTVSLYEVTESNANGIATKGKYVGSTTTKDDGTYEFKVPIDQNCKKVTEADKDNHPGMLVGMLLSCDSKKYTVVFSEVKNPNILSSNKTLPFTHLDEAGAGDASNCVYTQIDGDKTTQVNCKSNTDTDRDSDATDQSITGSDGQTVDGGHVASMTVQWLGVNSDQKAENIDAGVVNKTAPDLITEGLPKTGSWLILALLLLVITMAITVMTRSRGKFNEMKNEEEAAYKLGM